MHPDVYHSDLYKLIPMLRREQKSIKVFFGGNTGFGYGSPDIQKLFGKLTRNEIITRLEAFPNQNKLTSVAAEEQINCLLSGKLFHLVAVKKPLFSLDDWLRVLAKSDFYIAAPGFSMPFSHNAVEAMSVGAIPILQYPEMFSPPLTDKINCLKFDSLSDLIEKINDALHLDAEKLTAMRSNVLKYYDENLEPETAVENLFDQLPNIKRLYLNAEHLSVIELKKEISRNG